MGVASKPDCRTLVGLSAERTILFVDDDEQLLRAMQRRATANRLIVATTSANAQIAFAREDPDLIIVDMYLGAESGLELARMFMAVRPNVPIVVVSSKMDVELAADCLRAGVCDVYEKDKDIVPDEIVRRLEQRKRLPALEPSLTRELWHGIHRVFLECDAEIEECARRLEMRPATLERWLQMGPPKS